MKTIAKVFSVVTLGVLLSLASCNNKPDNEGTEGDMGASTDTTQMEMGADTSASDTTSNL